MIKPLQTERLGLHQMERLCGSGPGSQGKLDRTGEIFYVLFQGSWEGEKLLNAAAS